jgi:hypothetical protein
VSFLRYSVLVLAVAVATIVPLALLVPAGAPARAAVGFGAALAALNTLAAHALLRWSEGRSTKAFMGAILGGMVGRMALMLLAVVAGVLWLGLPRLPLVIALLAYFVLFLAIELALAQRRSGEAAPR